MVVCCEWFILIGLGGWRPNGWPPHTQSALPSMETAASGPSYRICCFFRLSYIVQVNNRLFVRSRKMLKQKDKEHNTGRANIMDEDNLILQSLPAATTAYTSYVHPPIRQERKKWVPGLANQSQKLRIGKMSSSQPICPSYNSTGQHFQQDCLPWQSSLSYLSSWAFATRKTGGATEGPRDRN